MATTKVFEAHRFIATGLSDVRCASCGKQSDAQEHRQGMNDRIGADGTHCPGCDELWPIDLTVRMMRFVTKDGKELTGRNLRVCHSCAGMKVDDWQILALRYERGWLTEDQYVARIEALAARAADPSLTLKVCKGRTRWGDCMELEGHPGPHVHKAIKAQSR